ncbi:hypothetical protein J2Y38_000505 [Flavobacterium sp. 2755]|uniref:hypothetical protein n=1 Tax=Flavobacterium sp. 2755 TaxID=2817765 RepID=UPI0028674570|nr:hypothetical protein [Flavobacterium sp. 2755]MDR6760326.1 hypothetical protein [Flavobacterium sp. 2755]
MPNFTIEDYKKAIQEKYKKETEADNFPNPSQANLRNLCWEIFKRIENPNSSDLIVFKSFFGFQFDPIKRTQFREQTDRFRPIGTFLKEETDPLNTEPVELAAILVDFQPRPFRKFREKGVPLYETQPGSGTSTVPQPFITYNEKKLIIELNENRLPDIPEPFITIDRKPSNLEFNEEGVNRVDEAQKLFPSNEVSPPRINLFVNAKEKIIYNFKNRLKKTAGVIILVFGLVGAVIYFAFFKNHCMQWSDDHYEVVDCSTKDNGNFNVVIPLDESLLDFRKLKACDTTTCFMKNGEAFVWYGKTSEGVDFFNDNGNGKHPETKATLRPVTHYMFNKYLKGKPCQ